MSKRALTVFVLSLIISAQVPAYCQETLKPAGQSTPDKDEDKLAWDFGRVREGEEPQHDFILKNESGKDMRIKEVNASCGCTAAQVKNKVLKPGESAAIEVKFKSKGYSGPVKQYVYVTTDNLDNPLIRYIITADVVK